MADYDTIVFENDGPVGRLTINRPDARNGMTTQMLEEAYDALGRAARDESLRVVVLTGAGNSFCPGADLNITNTGPRDTSGKRRSTEAFHVATLLHEMPQVTIAAINGAAAGAGLGWALACDLRVATASAMFNIAFLNVGVAGDMGGPWFLPRLLGAAKARELCFLPGKFGAEDALRIGMVSRVFLDETFREEAEAVVQRLAGAAPLAITALKQNFLAAERTGLADYITLESERHSTIMQSDDTREAMRAFMEKRTPVFKGS
ncbi:MAG: enoyl-CoA hydratase/isomerase family protein [Alphaproteobacteria bacterium]